MHVMGSRQVTGRGLFAVQEDAPAVWRGPMVMSALDSFMTKVSWSPLDVLVIDMPPGTGEDQRPN